MQRYFKRLFEYDKWAGHILLSKFEKQFPQNERIYQLFSHLLSAQLIWLDRCIGAPQKAIIWGERLPEEMRNDLEIYHQAWVEFIDQLQPDDFDKNITYTNSKGDTFTTRLSDIMTHVINHGTHHRGSIITLMKEEGFVLPNIDFITYAR
ncbi:DinB family protein [Mucilaginibacter paludis]|uniref:DinB family protein n=1 Tax=Mucilaginibacter paludis DSM 18603 TaxID=714943 RepID=H1Y3D4_9SPHI|nr:DinB family protein [Mucilaginibacter paludis]EHQ29289.1 DinB family protein [Mucilaginibacter paludis DSM 18603]